MDTHYFPFGEGPSRALPPTLRTAILRLKHKRLARFLDILLKYGVPLGKCYRVDELHRPLARYYQRASLHNLLNFLTERHSLFYKVPVHRADPVKKKKMGRPPIQFYIPTLDELAEHFETFIFDTPFPELSSEALSSQRTYIAALHEIQIRQNQKVWKLNESFPATKTLGWNVGVSKRTIWKIEREMHHLVRRRRFVDKPAIYDKLTYREQEYGAYFVWRGPDKFVRTPIASSRWFADASHV